MIISKEAMLNFDWHGAKVFKNNEADVSINRRADEFGVIFRNGCEKKLGDKFGRVEFAFVSDKVIAFRSSPTGYSIKPNGTRTTKSFNVRRTKTADNEDVVAKMMSFIGDYDLKYDKTFNLCYIDLEERK